MKLSKLQLAALIMLSIQCYTSIINGQILSDQLGLLSKLNERSFCGHYANPEDAHYIHQLKFKSILDGNALVLLKEVEELNFAMEITFYWNPEIQKIAFQSLNNKGQVSNGFVSVESNRLILTGENIEETGKRKFKQSFQFSENGKIEDKFYLMTAGEWKQRHLIIYE